MTNGKKNNKLKKNWLMDDGSVHCLKMKETKNIQINSFIWICVHFFIYRLIDFCRVSFSSSLINNKALMKKINTCFCLVKLQFWPLSQELKMQKTDSLECSERSFIFQQKKRNVSVLNWDEFCGQTLELYKIKFPKW